jgi:hypothetical protein
MANTTLYNGQQVDTSPGYLTNLQKNLTDYNKASGKSLGLEEYDRQLNPNSAGARWDTTKPTTGGLLQATAAPTYEAVKQNLSAGSSVQDQLANITANGSKLNTMAETAANKASNSRGLLNSSIAVGEAQNSVLKNALPVAQQDASTVANKDVNDAQFANSAAQFNANAKLQTQLAQLQSDTSLTVAEKQIKSQQLIAANENQTKLDLTAQDTATRLKLSELDTQTKTNLANLDNATKIKLADIDGANRQLLQTNISAANAYAQLSQNLANISSSKDMDQAAKQQATDNQIALFRQTLQAVGQVSNLDLSKYFETEPTSTSNYAMSDQERGQAAAQQGINKVLG